MADADWSALPEPALALIATRFELIEDFMAFRRTCTSWRAATSLKDLFDRSCPKLPLLMLNRPWDNRDECSDERKFFSLSKRKICEISLPEAKGMGHCSASKGWLIMLGSSNVMSLLNPITRVQIPLPNHPTRCFRFRSAVLSASPSETSEYVLMIVCKVSGSNPDAYCYMAFWKPGDVIWTEIELPENAYWVDDVSYYHGKFYALAGPSQIAVYDVLGPNPKKATKIMDLPWDLSRPHPHLVECAGRLLVIAPLKESANGCTPRNDLEMVELDVIKGTYTNITNLGNSALFLGDDENFSIDATRFPGVIEPNTFYFNNGSYQTAVCGRETVELRHKPRLHDIGGSRILGLAWINF